MAQAEKVVSGPEDVDPLVVAHGDHHISRGDINRDAIKVLSRLQDAGFEAYLVGGGVRDLYLGKKPKDFDISTNARPGQLRKLFRNSRTIGRRFRLVQVFFGANHILEVSTFRCRSEFDIKDKQEVLPSNNTFGSLADDACRRDLTINGLFYDISDQTIIDYTGGVADLDAGVVRIIGDPEVRITRDPVRMMRAIRHAARSGFTIGPVTWQAILNHIDKIHICPVSRIRDELLKDLRGGACSVWLPLAVESGLFAELFPFYRSLLAADKKLVTELAALLAVSDRLQGDGGQMAESVLLGLILIPWAMANYPVLAGSDGEFGDLFALSRQIRQDLDQHLQHLNLKRLIREEIAGMLSRLPLFACHARKGWPRWLQKKSYFKDSSRFYLMYCESKEGKPVADLRPVAPPATSGGGKKPGGRGRRNKGRRQLASFASDSQKGGVFGFRRH